MGSDSEAERTPHKDEKKKIVSLAPIAKPLAGKKLSKRTLKLVRRGIYQQIRCWDISVFFLACVEILSDNPRWVVDGPQYIDEIIYLQYTFWLFDSLMLQYWLCIIVAAEHKCLKRGVKEVVKSIRRGHKGSVICISDIYAFFFL